MTTPIYGSANSFPKDQCTWYANEGYHLKTGHYIPWNGNAAQWLTNSIAYGWSHASAPPSVPSICCLQAWTNGATLFGHVSLVESVNDDGSAVTSNSNWNGHVYPDLVNVTISPGPGVSFIWAEGGKLSDPGTGAPSSPSATSPSNILSALQSSTVIVDWFNSPARVAKLIVGVVLIGAAIVLLTNPELKIAGDVVSGAGKASGRGSSSQKGGGPKP